MSNDRENHSRIVHLKGVLYVVALLAGQTFVIAANSTNASAVAAEVFSIRETRGHNGRCDISLKFKGDILGHYSSVLGVRLNRAMDDTGADLCPTNGAGSEDWSSSGSVGFTPLRGWHQERPSETRYGNVTLRASSRTARVIKELHGELELFLPTLENGGVVVVEDFRAQPGSDLQSPALEKIGVRVTCHTKESFEAARNLADRKKPKEQFFDFGTQDDESRLFPGILGDPQNSPRNYIVLKMADPEKRVAGFAFRGADDRFLPVGNHRSVNDLRAFSFVTPILPEKIALHVYVATPGAIKKVPFRIENIPLP